MRWIAQDEENMKETASQALSLMWFRAGGQWWRNRSLAPAVTSITTQTSAEKTGPSRHHMRSFVLVFSLAVRNDDLKVVPLRTLQELIGYFEWQLILLSA